jgi:hypothetical protein
MKPQSVKERSKIAEGRERAPRGTDAQRRAGHPVKHPDRNDRSRAIWHLADRHQLAAAVLGVEDGHALPDVRVPGVVNLASVTDTGRMKRSLWPTGRHGSSLRRAIRSLLMLSELRSDRRRARELLASHATVWRVCGPGLLRLTRQGTG